MKDRAIVSMAAPAGDGSRTTRPPLFLTRFLALGLCGAWLAGCSLTLPMSGGEDVPTGSIKRAADLSPFSAEMDAEDWRRAKSALDTALDPQGNGASVAWDNPTSGAKGSFLPLASPYPKDDGICRPFTAHLNLKGETERVVQSSACRVNSGEWIVGRIVPISSKSLPKPGRNLADRAKSPHLD